MDGKSKRELVEASIESESVSLSGDQKSTMQENVVKVDVPVRDVSVSPEITQNDLPATELHTDIPSKSIDVQLNETSVAPVVNIPHNSNSFIQGYWGSTNAADITLNLNLPSSPKISDTLKLSDIGPKVCSPSSSAANFKANDSSEFDGGALTVSERITRSEIDGTNQRKRATSAAQFVEEYVKDLVHKPVHRYEWNEEHTSVFRNGGHQEENWLPEFLDLILIAGMIKMGNGLHDCGLNSADIFRTSMQFFLIFSTRYMIDEFWWNFYLDDLWNQILFFLYIAGVFLIALMVSYSVDTSMDEFYCQVSGFHIIIFFSGLLLTRSVLIVFWLVELYFDVAARADYYMHVIHNSITIAISIAAIVSINGHDTSESSSGYLMAGVVLNEFYLQFYKSFHTKPLLQLSEYWPLSLLQMNSKDHTTEVLFEADEELEAVQSRMGLFILIVLGEGVIQLLLPSVDVINVQMRKSTLIITLMGLLLLWSIAKQFFDAAQRRPTGHALRRCMRSGKQWIVFHAVAGFFTFVLGLGLKLVYGDMREFDGIVSFSHQVMLAVGAAGSVVSFAYMRFLHKGVMTYPKNRGRLAAYFLRFCIAFLHFAVIWFDGLHNNEAVSIVLIHLLIAMGMNSLDLYNFNKLKHAEEPGQEEPRRRSTVTNRTSDAEDASRLDASSAAPASIRSTEHPVSSDTISIAAQRYSSSNIFAAIDPFTGRKERAMKRMATPTGSSTDLLANTAAPRSGEYPASSDTISIAAQRYSSSNIFAAIDPFTGRKERAMKRMATSTGSSTNLLANTNFKPISRDGSSANLANISAQNSSLDVSSAGGHSMTRGVGSRGALSSMSERTLQIPPALILEEGAMLLPSREEVKKSKSKSSKDRAPF